MADIFISYARSTAAQAQQIAQALRSLGYGVWRDDELPAHRAYAEVIEERLKAAKAVVVIWSVEGAKSEWVRSEADRARNDRKLVQLSVDGTAPPMPFDQIQCAALHGWSGDVTAPGWRKVVSSIADLVGSASPAKAPSAQSERAGISICVLPFANMSNDPEQEYFADGISEDIITDLSKVSALAVISRNSAFTFKGKHVDLPQVARTLNVSHMLEGSVRKSGNRVRITAQLIDGLTNDHVWAERYDRNLDDIFALQDEISEAIVSALKLKLLPGERKAIEDRGTNNLEAYDKYLRARAVGFQLAPQEILRAAQMLREVLAVDPNFALAWSGLHQALLTSLIWVPENSEAALKEMTSARERALALAPDAWWTKGMLADYCTIQRNWAAAEESICAALAVASNCELFTRYGRFLSHVGRIAEAAEQLERARHADPLSLSISSLLQAHLDFAGRPDEAQAEYMRGNELVGSSAMAEHFALLRLMLRNPDDDVGIKAQFAVMLGRQNIPMPLNQVIADCFEQPTKALVAIRTAFDEPANQTDARMGQIAWYADYFGDKDLALAALRRQIIDLKAIATYTLWRPTRTGLRTDPRFKAIVRDYGLHDYWRKSGKWADFARPLGDDDFEIIR